MDDMVSVADVARFLGGQALKGVITLNQAVELACALRFAEKDPRWQADPKDTEDLVQEGYKPAT